MGYKALDWQSGYGVVSFGTRDLPWVVDSVKKQRERHRIGKIVYRLERINVPETRLKPNGENPRERGSQNCVAK